MSERDPQDEAHVAMLAMKVNELLKDGEVAFDKLARIEEIVDDVVACIPTTDPEVPWNALLAIRKVMR